MLQFCSMTLLTKSSLVYALFFRFSAVRKCLEIRRAKSPQIKKTVWWSSGRFSSFKRFWQVFWSPSRSCFRCFQTSQPKQRSSTAAIPRSKKGNAAKTSAKSSKAKKNVKSNKKRQKQKNRKKQKKFEKIIQFKDGRINLSPNLCLFNHKLDVFLSNSFTLPDSQRNFENTPQKLCFYNFRLCTINNLFKLWW